MMKVIESLCLPLWFQVTSNSPFYHELSINPVVEIMEEELDEDKKGTSQDKDTVKGKGNIKKGKGKANRKKDKRMELKDEEDKKIKGVMKLKKNKNRKIKKEGKECSTCGQVYTAVSELYRHLSLSHFRNHIQKEFSVSFSNEKVST